MHAVPLDRRCNLRRPLDSVKFRCLRVVRRGQAIAAKTPIPPGVVGYNPKYQPLAKFDVPLANKLLDQFGYMRGPDGMRNLPDAVEGAIEQVLLHGVLGGAALQRCG